MSSWDRRKDGRDLILPIGKKKKKRRKTLTNRFGMLLLSLLLVVFFFGMQLIINVKKKTGKRLTRQGSKSCVSGDH